MAWPSASHAVLFVVVALCILAKAQAKERNSSVLLSSTGDGLTRESSIKGQAVRINIIDDGSLLSNVGTEHLAQVKAASGFSGSLETLAAQLAADDDLVGCSLADLTVQQGA
jgi:hypothetical protein